MSSSDQKSNINARPPIVVVMGHVDHGKTTLLDYLRKTRVAEKEAGGITQSIGAYEIDFKGQKICFIDTPGHKAFTKMRERGANVADLAILVVSSDDGVKPQTKEAIDILIKSKTPFVVAINKIDKNNSDIEKTKQDLLANGVLLEGFGGQISWHGISAKTGEGIDDLLDLIVLMWQMENLTYDSENNAKGFILESKMDSQRGIIASVIVRDGTLKVGDGIVTPSACGKIKVLENFLGQRVETLCPSSPALVVGFESIPDVGEEFESGQMDLEKARNIEPQKFEKKEISTVPDEDNVISLIIKADVSGSLEALGQIISSMKFENVTIKIISQEVGEINDSDIKSAKTFNAFVIGFNVKSTKAAESLARARDVQIISSDIIYRIIEAIEEKVNNFGKKEELGELEILAIFSQKNRKQVIGGKVTSGFIAINQRISIERGEQVLGYGRITNLQQNKKDTKKVEDGECGLMIESEITVAVGDKIIVEK
ncbi:MAG: translation initiation factor IF-2 [Candidatus Paceibacterota bacterium]|jgi:translation initiation factor IF-2